MTGENRQIQLGQLLTKKQHRMTCIIGGKCKDGVVLISDRKITYVDKPSEFRNKLHRDYYPIVTGGAGGSKVYENFRHKLLPQLQSVQWKEIQVSGIIPMYSSNENNFFNYQNRISQIVVEVNTGEPDEYKTELLTAIQLSSGDAILTYITKDGYPTNGQLYRSIGTGAQFSYVFLKPFYDNEKEITMFKLARLGYFAIRFIGDFNIDDGVGGKPQFWCVPNTGGLFNDEDRQNWVEQFERESDTIIKNYKLRNIDAFLTPDG